MLDEPKKRYRLARPRLAAKGMVVCGRLGTPVLPHTVAVASTHWVYDHRRMNLHSMRLLLVQSVPGGSPDRWLEMLQAVHERAGEGNPPPDAGVVTVADVTRGLLFSKEVYARIPTANIARVTPNWETNHDTTGQLCGRLLLMNSLRQRVNDKTLTSALLDEHPDPTVWSKPRFDAAFAAAQAKPPREQTGQETPVADPGTVDDEGVLTVAHLCWWAELAPPTPYHDDELFRDAEARERKIREWEDAVARDVEIDRGRGFW
jgi:hypothetical protein